MCETCGDYLLYEAADDAYYSTDPILAPWHSGLEIHRPTAATCETDGTIAFWYCRDCGKYFEPTEYAEGQYAFDGANRELTAQDVIVPAGHTLTKTEGAPATCAADGSIDYWTCSVCHKLFADETAATEITAADVVVAPGHRMTFVPAKDASCKADGNVAYYNCERCGKFYADEAGNSEITDKNSVVIKKTDRAYGEWIAEQAATCADEGVKGHYACSVCGKYFDENKNELRDLAIAVDPTNHAGMDTTVGAKAATCNEDGYTGDVICNACRGVKIKGAVISNATVAHTPQKTAAKAATCENPGNVEYYACTVCKKLFKDAACTQETTADGVKLSPLGHAYGAWTTIRNASCTEEGMEQRVCANDGSHKETRPIAKTAHEDDGSGFCKHCGAELNESGKRCKCGQIHTGPFAGLIRFFHTIVYFFKNLFK